MVDIEILEQKPMMLVEVNEKLNSIRSDKKGLNFRAEKVHSYVHEFATLKKKEAQELYEKLKALNMIKLRERHIVKIIDIMPRDSESLKMLFAGEATSLKQDELKRILDVINVG